MLLDRIKEKLGWRKKVSPSGSGSDNSLSFDLFYQLSYMSVIAAGGVPRNKIFERAAYLNCSSARYFKKVEAASKKLKYDYARACRAVGDATNKEDVKGLLLRFSSSLISGEPEAEFLAREAEVRAESYNNEYARQLEAMKLWTDAYISLILSGDLVVIIGTVSTMIYKIEPLVILGMSFIAISTAAIGV